MSKLPVLYSRATCGPCKTIKYWFSKNNIEYEERSVDDSEYLKELINETGVFVPPVVIWDNEVVIGPNLPRLSELRTKLV